MQDAGIPVVVVSNNNEQRVAKALEKFDLDFVARALKPFSKGLKEGAKKLNLHPSELVMVGDQLMTDIKATNANGHAFNTSKTSCANRFLEDKI